MLRKLIPFLVLCFAASAHGHAQQVDPSYQISWPTCSAGQAYSPNTNVCENVILAAPSAAQTVAQPSLAQPLGVNYLSEAFNNGAVQAAAFCGLGTIGGVATPACSADMCAKIRSALTYAIGNNFPLVDATAFSGTQQCAADPIGNLITSGNTVKIGLRLGYVHIMTQAQWNITNYGVQLVGMGPMYTQVEYNGTSNVQAVLRAANVSFIKVEGIFFIAGAASTTHVLDGVNLVEVHRSELNDVSAWGAVNTGLHTQGAVTDTFYRVKVSNFDALYLGVGNANGYTTPGTGFWFDASTDQTTDGTCIDCAAEGITSGTGFYLASANSMTFTSGTSEQNLKGVLIASVSKWNSFIGMDIEGNTQNANGVDINDNGQGTVWQTVIADSNCTGGCTASAIAGGNGGQIIISDTGLTGGYSGSFNVIGNLTKFSTGGSFTVLSPAGFANAAFSLLSNAVGLQLTHNTACTISAGALGNSCNSAVTLPVTEPDTNYRVVACTNSLDTGPTTTGDVFSKTTTGFTVRLIAMSSSATGAGDMDCLVIHQ
jgi:hypothetical protein